MRRLESEPPIRARIAVETGWVLMGAVGVDGTAPISIEQWPAVGAAPHIAARLQGLARPNGIIAGPGTLALLAGRFATEPADTRGISLPVPVAAAHVLGGAGAGDPLAQLLPGHARATGQSYGKPVGRDAELDLMRTRWKMVVGGAGQVILLSGEPGIGKSRLLAAFLEDSGIVRGVVAMFCSPAASDTPFQPVIEPLRLALGLAAGAAPDEIRSRAAAFAQSLNLAEWRCAAALATLLDAPPADPLPPDELRRAIQETLFALVDRLIQERPLLILAEDVHWSDASTLELLRKLADRWPLGRVLLIISYRSDFVLPWADRSHVLRLALRSLSTGDARRLTTELANGQGLKLGDGQREAIIGRSDGVPLFIEEFVRALADPEAAARNHYSVDGCAP
jgi:hypothetical protein